MKTIDMKLDEIKPYDKNPRDNDKAVDAVAASIEEFGFKVPIVVDKDNVIVAGHTRLKAAEKLGLKKVPVIIADDLTPEQIKAFRLADNKTAELAGWDFGLLDEELFSIEDIDMSQFGFHDISGMVDNFFIEGEEENKERVDDIAEEHFLKVNTHTSSKYKALVGYLKKNDIDYKEIEDD